MNDTAIPKVPSYIPFIGAGLKFGKNADVFLKACQEKYGNVFCIRLGNRDINVLLNPLDYPAFFKHSKDLTADELNLQTGAAAFGYDVEAYKKSEIEEGMIDAQTKLLYGSELDKMSTTMQRNLEELLFRDVSKDWKESRLKVFSSDLIFEAGLEAIFGKGLYSPELRKEFDVLDKNFFKLVGGMPELCMPGIKKAKHGLKTKLVEQREDACELSKERWRMARESANPFEDVPSLDIGLLWASQSNTVVFMFYTLVHILRDKHLHGILKEEIDTLFANSESKTAHGAAVLNTTTLNQLPKLDSVVSETLRLVASSFLVREAQKDLSIELYDGKTLVLKKGEFAALYPRLTHLNEEIYENPNEFQWDRFLGRSGPNKFSYKNEKLKFNLLPFGGGGNICPGRHFVKNEVMIVVAELLHYLDFDLIDTHIPELDMTRSAGGAIGALPNDDLRFRYRFR